MTMFERFEAILNHKRPDKMPFYFPTIACSVASEIMGREINSGADSLHFKEGLAWLEGEQAHSEFVHKYMEDAIELNKILKADVVRQTWRKDAKPSKKIDENTLLFGDKDGKHIICRFFPEYQSYGIIEDTTQPKDIDDLKNYIKNELKSDAKVTEDELENIYKDQLQFKKMADPYFPTIAGGFGIGVSMYSPIWLEATLLESDLVADYFMHEAEKYVQYIPWLAKKGFKFINGGGDLALNTGPIYSPDTFKKLIIPPLKKLVNECNKQEMCYCYRTDGNIWAISDYMFNEAGVPAYGEVDRKAGMTVGKLREKFPNLIILGNNSSAVLSNVSIDDVRKETRDTLEESGGLNYIAGPSNAIVHGTPVENVYAMIEEIEKYKP